MKMVKQRQSLQRSENVKRRVALKNNRQRKNNALKSTIMCCFVKCARLTNITIISGDGGDDDGGDGSIPSEDEKKKTGSIVVVVVVFVFYIFIIF
jgi:hypothetical protein